MNGNTQPLALLPSCNATINGNPAIGRPAVRLASFLSNFGDRGRFYSICQSDYSAALTDIGKTLFNAISPCLEGDVDPTDVDPNNPGTQLQCTVTDVVNHRHVERDETADARVSDAGRDDASTRSARARAGAIDQNTTNCPAPDTGYEMNVVRDRAARDSAPRSTSSARSRRVRGLVVMLAAAVAAAASRRGSAATVPSIGTFAIAGRSPDSNAQPMSCDAGGRDEVRVNIVDPTTGCGALETFDCALGSAVSARAVHRLDLQPRFRARRVDPRTVAPRP